MEIFDYLDWNNLSSAFYGINKRINQLLMSVTALSLHSNSSYPSFLSIEQFKQIQHFRLICNSSYEDESTFSKLFPSFSNLISLSVSVNVNDVAVEFPNEITMIYFHQDCPFLRRLSLDGNAFDRELQITNNIPTFSFPSLVYINIGKLHFILALQILDQCPQLRSFSAKLYGHPIDARTTLSSFRLPTRISMGLPAMKKLNFGGDDYFSDEFGVKFLELLIPCCPNLCTFILEVLYTNECYKLLEVNWWTHPFALNNKLKRISLHFKWTVRDIRPNWHEKIPLFKSSSFFTQLNAKVQYDFTSEFMRSMTFDLHIKN